MWEKTPKILPQVFTFYCQKNGQQSKLHYYILYCYSFDIEFIKKPPKLFKFVSFIDYILLHNKIVNYVQETIT